MEWVNFKIRMGLIWSINLYRQTSYYSFDFFGSGRANIKYLYGSIELRKRQDLFTTAIMEFISPEYDHIEIEVRSL